MVFYFGETLKTLKESFKLQKRAVRLIANISRTTSCKPFFKKLKIIILPVKFFCIQNVFKWIQN